MKTDIERDEFVRDYLGLKPTRNKLLVVRVTDEEKKIIQEFAADEFGGDVSMMIRSLASGGKITSKRAS